MTTARNTRSLPTPISTANASEVRPVHTEDSQQPQSTFVGLKLPTLDILQPTQSVPGKQLALITASPAEIQSSGAAVFDRKALEQKLADSLRSSGEELVKAYSELASKGYKRYQITFGAYPHLIGHEEERFPIFTQVRQALRLDTLVDRLGPAVAEMTANDRGFALTLKSPLIPAPNNVLGTIQLDTQGLLTSASVDPEALALNFLSRSAQRRYVISQGDELDGLSPKARSFTSDASPFELLTVRDEFAPNVDGLAKDPSLRHLKSVYDGLVAADGLASDSSELTGAALAQKVRLAERAALISRDLSSRKVEATPAEIERTTQRIMRGRAEFSEVALWKDRKVVLLASNEENRFAKALEDPELRKQLGVPDGPISKTAFGVSALQELLRKSSSEFELIRGVDSNIPALGQRLRDVVKDLMPSSHQLMISGEAKDKILAALSISPTVETTVTLKTVSIKPDEFTTKEDELIPAQVLTITGKDGILAQIGLLNGNRTAAMLIQVAPQPYQAVAANREFLKRIAELPLSTSPLGKPVTFSFDGHGSPRAISVGIDLLKDDIAPDQGLGVDELVDAFAERYRNAPDLVEPRDHDILLLHDCHGREFVGLFYSKLTERLGRSAPLVVVATSEFAQKSYFGPSQPLHSNSWNVFANPELHSGRPGFQGHITLGNLFDPIDRASESPKQRGSENLPHHTNHSVIVPLREDKQPVSPSPLQISQR